MFQTGKNLLSEAHNDTHICSIWYIGIGYKRYINGILHIFLNLPPKKFLMFRDESNLEQIVRNNNILAVMWAEIQNKTEKKLQNSIKMIDLFPIPKNTLDIIYNKTLLTQHTLHIHVSMVLV